MKLHCLCAAVYVALTLGAEVRIINGSVVKKSSPLHAMFALPTKSAGSDEWLGCGASIISPTFALSSAHCFGGGKSPCTGPQHIALWIGDIQLTSQGDSNVVVANQDGKSFRVEAELICSPAFDGKCSHGNDIALLKLKNKVPDWIKPVTLDLDGKAASKVGEMITPTGFGLTEDAIDPTSVSYSSPPSLRQVDVTVLAQDSASCRRMYVGGYGCSDSDSEGPAKNEDMQVCAGTVSGIDKDACAGDSGSPVLDKFGVQVAMVSYGGGPGNQMQGPGRICGDPDYPGVYGRVSAFREFITSTVLDLPLANSGGDSDDMRPISPHLRR
jgi:secreted trypsin-like serine protease